MAECRPETPIPRKSFQFAIHGPREGKRGGYTGDGRERQFRWEFFEDRIGARDWFFLACSFWTSSRASKTVKLDCT